MPCARAFTCIKKLWEIQQLLIEAKPNHPSGVMFDIPVQHYGQGTTAMISCMAERHICSSSGTCQDWWTSQMCATAGSSASFRTFCPLVIFSIAPSRACGISVWCACVYFLPFFPVKNWHGLGIGERRRVPQYSSAGSLQNKAESSCVGKCPTWPTVYSGHKLSSSIPQLAS